MNRRRYGPILRLVGLGLFLIALAIVFGVAIDGALFSVA